MCIRDRQAGVPGRRGMLRWILTKAEGHVGPVHLFKAAGCPLTLLRAGSRLHHHDEARGLLVIMGAGALSVHVVGRWLLRGLVRGRALSGGRRRVNVLDGMATVRVGVLRGR